MRAMIEDSDNEVFVSVAAVWETAIKYPLGRSDGPPVSAYQLIVEIEGADFELLDVRVSHAAFVERLPPIHGDPFDRLMLAQAMVENLQLVTFDRQLMRYDAPILTWD
ncbi:MAG: type II toxin-antitoxin system VapC family toxin [Aquamicrobium sp.]|nr:type II toxin-antitoxin system VapC family toxin [Aquamicrobium sp.]